ncbi:flagellar biosynthesis protein FlhB [soil metagenome]
MSEKTEEPTPQRLRKAREDGDSGVSVQAASAVGFLIAVALFPSAVIALADRSASRLRGAIARAADAEPSAPSPEALLPTIVFLVAPVLLATGLTSAIVQVVQSGGAVATKKLSPSLDRLDLVQGIKNLFSTTRLFSVLRSVVLGGAVLYLAYGTLRAGAPDLAHLAGRLAYVGVVAGTLGSGLARRAALVGLALGAVDLFVTRRQWMSKLKMSKDEIKREHKESEGDPQIKQARERANHEMLASAAVANVKNATVVVVNPTHLACALRYDSEEGDEAPVIVASGEGDLAKRIIEAARAYGIPVLRDVPLARALIELEIGGEIPEDLYEAVAEILREAYAEPKP